MSAALICAKALNLVAASLSDYPKFAPTVAYTPKALEPNDALADRFIRAVECALRYFRSRELQEFAEQSDTTRNLRNRIVGDYLPEQTAEMFGFYQRRVRQRT